MVFVVKQWLKCKKIFDIHKTLFYFWTVLLVKQKDIEPRLAPCQRGSLIFTKLCL